MFIAFYYLGDIMQKIVLGALLSVLAVSVIAFIFLCNRALNNGQFLSAAPAKQVSPVQTSTPSAETDLVPQEENFSAPLQLPFISRRPAPYLSGLRGGILKPEQKTPHQNVKEMSLVINSQDISDWDLTAYTADELKTGCYFDSLTIFPPTDKMPKGFEPEKLLKINQNPGLHIHTLHKEYVDGNNVNIAIVGRPLLTTHQEYAKNIVFYEETPFVVQEAEEAQPEGVTAASLAVGKTVGIAPKANLFFFAHDRGDFRKEQTLDLRPMAQSLERIYELNKQLSYKIDVVAVTDIIFDKAIGVPEVKEAINKLENSGVAVFTQDDNFFIINRTDPMNSPDEIETFDAPLYWNERATQTIAFPGTFQTVASARGDDVYEYLHGNLFEHAVIYATGIYALAKQVDPTLNKERFVRTAFETATKINSTHNNKEYSFSLVNPSLLIQHLKQLRAPSALQPVPPDEDVEHLPQPIKDLVQAHRRMERMNQQKREQN